MGKGKGAYLVNGEIENLPNGSCRMICEYKNCRQPQVLDGSSIHCATHAGTWYPELEAANRKKSVNAAIIRMLTPHR